MCEASRMWRSVGQEDEYVATTERADFFDGVGHAAERVDFFAAVFAAKRAVEKIDGMCGLRLR